ncbi:hypothetical protein J2S55_008964 [Streptosporangium brasiliense]|uniref:Uncharacterized protein n=1 Tax=Streptosporangium brasiliense TaxID=47480 RepID=A0ABT9RK72_9ACTN|nr:hypothetical protein [Streptosporangium brasiliense]
MAVGGTGPLILSNRGPTWISELPGGEVRAGAMICERPAPSRTGAPSIRCSTSPQTPFSTGSRSSGTEKAEWTPDAGLRCRSHP